MPPRATPSATVFSNSPPTIIMTHSEQQDLLAHAMRLITQDAHKQEGIECLLRAAEAGMPEAMQYYAEYLLVEQKDIPAATAWYEKCFRSGYDLDLGSIYRHSTPEFRAAIDARFSAAERKALHIRPQALYDALIRVFFALFCCGLGMKIGHACAYPYADFIGMGLGLLVAACMWKRVSFSALSDKKWGQ